VSRLERLDSLEQNSHSSTLNHPAGCKQQQGLNGSATIPYQECLRVHPFRSSVNTHRYNCKGSSTHMLMTASGTLSSLSRVLCTLRSNYLCAIGLTLVFSLNRVTPASSSSSRKELYSCHNGANASIRPINCREATARGYNLRMQIHSKHTHIAGPCTSLTLHVVLTQHRSGSKTCYQVPRNTLPMGWVSDIYMSCLFTRRYWGNRSCFLFLSRLICLS